VFSPRDARLAAKLEAMFGDRDVADFWSAVAAAIVRAERPLRLPRGKSRSTPWALLLRPIDDLLPPVFVEWFRATAHRRAEAALCDDEPECEEDSSCDVANLDTLDALDEIATEDERAWRGARFLARLGRRRSAGLRMYVELLLLGQLDCLSTEEIATVVSRECGERVTRPDPEVPRPPHRYRPPARPLGSQPPTVTQRGANIPGTVGGGSMLFLKILQGETALDARTIVATSDADVIAAVGKAVAQRLGVELQRVARPPQKDSGGDG